jgi:hypothetical protein
MGATTEVLQRFLSVTVVAPGYCLLIAHRRTTPLTGRLNAFAYGVPNYWA